MRCRRAILSYTTYTPTYIAYLPVIQADILLGVGDVGEFLPFSRERVHVLEYIVYIGINHPVIIPLLSSNTRKVFLL